MRTPDWSRPATVSAICLAGPNLLSVYKLFTSYHVHSALFIYFIIENKYFRTHNWSRHNTYRSLVRFVVYRARLWLCMTSFFQLESENATLGLHSPSGDWFRFRTILVLICQYSLENGANVMYNVVLKRGASIPASV